MSLCGQSPLFVPTTVNAVLRNIDAVDVAATNLSCTKLTVNGNPISDAFQNVSATPGWTLVNGTLEADTIKSNSAEFVDLVTTGTNTMTAINCSAIACTGSITSSLDVSGSTLTGTLATATQNNVTKIGTQTSFATSGSITQTGGTATLLGTTVSSLSNSGTLTQTGAATFATNVTQSAGTASLKAVTATSISNTGTLTQTGAATFGGNVSVTGTLTVSTPETTLVSYNGTSAGWPVTLSKNWTRIMFRDISITGSFNAYINNVDAGTTFTGDTSGSAGNATTPWATSGTLYLANTTTSSLTVPLSGWIDFHKVSTTEWVVCGYASYNAANYYSMDYAGKLVFPANTFNIILKAGPGTPTGTVYVMST